MTAFPDIRSLLDQNGLEIHFQPVVSIRRRAVVGVEALSRGREATGLIAPERLFGAAQHQNLCADLDSACQNAALHRFAPLPGALDSEHHELMLFVNAHPVSIETPGFAAHLEQRVSQIGIEGRRVVVEILESQIDESAARRTVHELREAGFLVALDDIGAGSSNLDRVPMLRPDILKADRSLIRGLHTDYYQREVFKSLVILSEKIGGWIVAEGIETLEEALSVLELGGDLMQGYFFARPSDLQRIEAPDGVADAARSFKARMLEKVVANRRVYESRVAVVDEIRAAFSPYSLAQFNSTQFNSTQLESAQLESAQLETVLYNSLIRHPELESGCILEADGIQITETVVNDLYFKRAKTVIFAPSPRGTDHSCKEQFYLLQEGRLDPYVSAPYVPLPSGHLCVTVTASLGQNGAVLVLHFRENVDKLLEQA